MSVSGRARAISANTAEKAIAAPGKAAAKAGSAAKAAPGKTRQAYSGYAGPARSTPILLAAGAITFGNEWIHNPAKPNWKIPVATLTISVIFAAGSKIPGAEPFFLGVSVIALTGVLLGSFTPGVPSPAQQILDFMGYGGKQARPRGAAGTAAANPYPGGISGRA